VYMYISNWSCSCFDDVANNSPAIYRTGENKAAPCTGWGCQPQSF
jgi:hypothetical protein